MRASLEHATDAELERHAKWLLHMLVQVQLLIARRQSEKRDKNRQILE